MINKNKFSIKDTKKVLHKVGKRWVVVSAVLLGLVAGGVAVNAQANAANTSVGTQAVSVPATTGESQQEQENTDASKAINKFKSLHQKGYVNEALNGVNNRLRPKLNNTNAINGYNNLTSMAQTNNLTKFSAGSGEPLGSANSASGSNSSDNTWFGTLQEAENDVNAIHGNTASNSRYAKLLDLVNNVVNTNIPGIPNYPINRTINPNTDLTPDQQNGIENEVINANKPSSAQLQPIAKSYMLQEFNTLVSKGHGAIVVNGTPDFQVTSISMPQNLASYCQVTWPTSVAVNGTANIPSISIANVINKIHSLLLHKFTLIRLMLLHITHLKLMLIFQITKNMA